MKKFKQSDNLKALRFLKELQDEMITQDTDGQATPRFWVIRDFEEQLSQNEIYENAYILTDGGIDSLNGSFKLDDFIENVITYHFTSFDGEELDRLQLYRELEDTEEIVEWFQENYDEDCSVSFWEVQPVLSTNSMFLTKKDAIEHLKSNDYHYHEKAHTYAMTAWRSPSVERLYEIIEGVDWEQLEKLVESK